MTRSVISTSPSPKGSSLRVEDLSRSVGSHDLPIRNHPDVLYFPDESKLGIAEVRKIKEHFSLKPYQAKGRTVVLEDATKLTIEAQNALLKTLEELPADALFILGADSDSKLLPTVLSRCEIVILEATKLPIESKRDSIASLQSDIERLLESSISERFEYMEKLKDREEFLHALVQYFHQTLSVHPGGVHSDVEFLKELLQAEEWAKQNVNIRAILEYLMLKLPPAE